MPLNTSLPIRNAPEWIRFFSPEFRSGEAATTLRLGGNDGAEFAANLPKLYAMLRRGATGLSAAFAVEPVVDIAFIECYGDLAVRQYLRGNLDYVVPANVFPHRVECGVEHDLGAEHCRGHVEGHLRDAPTYCMRIRRCSPGRSPLTRLAPSRTRPAGRC